MKILAFDSTATAASVAICDNGKVVSEFFVNAGLTHSRTLVPMLDAALKNTDSDLKSIDALAISNGPGSFTGVRIGVAVAKGIAFAENLTCFEISTLESMAYNLILTDCIVCAAMDARCAQVYNAVFEIKYGEVVRLCEDRALAIADLKSELTEKYPGKRIILVGDGAELCFKEFMDTNLSVELAPDALRFQKASSVAAAAFDKLNKGEKAKSASELLPSYLRLSQAERELKKKENK